MASDLDAWLDGYQPHEAEVSICQANGLIAEHARADAALAAAEGADAIQAAAETVADLEARIEASSRVFRFRSLPARQWADLLRDHAPTEEQRRSDPGVEFNDDTFPPEAVSACSLDGITVEQAARLRDTLQSTEWAKVWGTVLQANVGVLAAPKSLLAGVVLRRNGGSGTTSAPEESPAPSS